MQTGRKLLSISEKILVLPFFCEPDVVRLVWRRIVVAQAVGALGHQELRAAVVLRAEAPKVLFPRFRQTA